MMTYTKKMMNTVNIAWNRIQNMKYNEILVQSMNLFNKKKKNDNNNQKTLLKRMKNIVSMFFLNVPQQLSRKDWNISKISEPSVILTSEIKNDTVRNC